MEFHIARAVRERVQLDELLFSFTGNVLFANVAASRKLTQRLNALAPANSLPEQDDPRRRAVRHGVDR